MSWKEATPMSLRLEFCTLATGRKANVAALCRRFGISGKTGYKWLDRFRREGEAGLADRPRRPHAMPRRTAPRLEQRVRALRARHPTWGGRKLARRLQDLG